MKTGVFIIALLLTSFNITIAQSGQREYVVIDADTFYRRIDTAGVYNSLAKGRIEIYSFVEQMPEAGYNIPEYIMRNMKFPKDLDSNSYVLKVYVSFVVTDKGKIVDPKIIGKSHPNQFIREEVLRVVNSFPAWKPAKSNGRPAFVYYTLPIQLHLE